MAVSVAAPANWIPAFLAPLLALARRELVVLAWLVVMLFCAARSASMFVRGEGVTGATMLFLIPLFTVGLAIFHAVASYNVWAVLSDLLDRFA